MSTITKSVLHDATPSWNGYNYQGKVGLYVCLEKILIEARKGVDSTSFESYLDEHHIEYEWIEDFAIKKNDNYLSLHQVKHRSRNKFNDHVSAISTILHRKNGVLSDTDIFKYFTFSRKCKSGTDSTKVSIKSELIKHSLIDSNGTINSNWKDRLSGVDFRYRESIFKCFSDFELLMKKAFSSSLTYFHTADKVDSPTSGICEIAAIPSHLVSGLVNPKSLSCKGIYLSFDCQKEYKLALSDDELNCELELKIGELLKLLHKNNHFLEDDVKLFKTALCSLIHQNIAKRHQDIREKVDDYTFPLQRIKSSVSFKKITKELRKNYRIQDNNYWNLVCRQNFEMAYTEKLADLEYLLNNSCIDFDLYVQYQSNLELLRTDVIEQYLPNDCVEFLKKIYPYCIRTNLIDHQYYTAISEPLKIKNIFLDFFQKVNKPSYKLTLKCSKNIYVYQPTCIDFNENDDHLKNIAINRVRKGLAENIGSPFLVDINVDYMVVKSSRADDEIPTGIEKITDVEGYVSSIPRLKNSDKFTERKEIYFVDSRKALGEING